jgi:protein gp37
MTVVTNLIEHPVHHGTPIGWTHVLGYKGESWNPTSGTLAYNVCARISPGCDFCYAVARVKRLFHVDYAHVPFLNETPRLDARELRRPYTFSSAACFFLASMTDVFWGWITDDWLDQIFDVVRDTPQHLYQVLTKRPTRMVEYLDRVPWWPLDNVWVGTVDRTAAVHLAHHRADQTGGPSALHLCGAVTRPAGPRAFLGRWQPHPVGHQRWREPLDARAASR